MKFEERSYVDRCLDVVMEGAKTTQRSLSEFLRTATFQRTRVKDINGKSWIF